MTDADPSDDVLLARSLEGENDAFEALVRRHARRVLAHCVHASGDRLRGEELAQDVWLAVWQGRTHYRTEGKFVVWLMTIARNRVRNAHRDRARSVPVAQTIEPANEPATADPPSSALDRLLASERRTRISSALSRLSEELREAVLLRFAQDLPYEDIARVVGTGESTARSRVFHGLRELRKRVGDAS